LRITYLNHHTISLLKARGEGRRLRNEEFYDLYSSPNIIRVIAERKMIRAEQVASIGRGEVLTEFWWETLRGRNHLEDPGVHVKIILKCIFKEDRGIGWIDLAQERDR
jgi:hypothetical protein